MGSRYRDWVELDHQSLTRLAFGRLERFFKPVTDIGILTNLAVEGAQDAYAHGRAKPHELALACAARARWAALLGGSRPSKELRKHIRELTQVIIELERLVNVERDRSEGFRQYAQALRHLAIVHRELGEHQSSHWYIGQALSYALSHGAPNREVRQLKSLARKYR